MKLKGDFTLPGEKGFEKLTLELAEKWGADVIRDSDGTALSDDLLNAGYQVYSTICVIRGHNEWAKDHLDKLQQTFLMAGPVIAQSEEMEIHLMEKYFEQQFCVNDSDESKVLWQVFDRTTNQEVNKEEWSYNIEKKCVQIRNCIKYHEYSVNFLAYRIWEEISMYNHITNNWNQEHLMPIDPIYPESQKYIVDWMKNWCETHEKTNVVRFTSLFYNFVWIWGSKENNRSLFSDWGSYDFTVSPRALALFQKEYGYEMKAEDFINQGKLNVTHMPPSKKKKDWIAFINKFVVDFGHQLIQIAHDYGKRAFIFYDDSWIGSEPYGEKFPDFKFDGIIKCVFSGYEARLCAGVDTPCHEIRLHPYLFPVGLGGLPTFQPGGNPTKDAREYWINVRRALLREKIDRIGLGGYLHLTKEFPDFIDYIEKIADEFRIIKSLHLEGKPRQSTKHVAVLHSWGSMRPWTLSGHFHETKHHDLIHVIEALAGMPVQVDYIDFEDVKAGKLHNYQVVINAGFSGDAWSGGDNWKDTEVVEKLTEWVYAGGNFIGINEPTAVEGYNHFFRMASIIGVDLDKGDRVCHGKYNGVIASDISIESLPKLRSKERLYLIDDNTEIIYGNAEEIYVTHKRNGNGESYYLSGFRYNMPNVKLLMELIVGKEEYERLYLTNNPYVETCYFPNSEKLLVINNSDKKQKFDINIKGENKSMEINESDFVELLIKEM